MQLFTATLLRPGAISSSDISTQPRERTAKHWQRGWGRGVGETLTHKHGLLRASGQHSSQERQSFQQAIKFYAWSFLSVKFNGSGNPWLNGQVQREGLSQPCGLLYVEPEED